jgi:hypothetical protein
MLYCVKKWQVPNINNESRTHLDELQRYVIKFVRDATGRWFCPGTPVFSTKKTDRHDIAKILLKVALNTIKQANKQMKFKRY